MRQEIDQLQQTNDTLKLQIDGLTSDKESIQGELSNVVEENSALKTKIEDLNEAVDKLQQSEQQIQSLVSDLSSKIENSGTDEKLLEQLTRLEELHKETGKEISSLTERINAFEELSTTPEAVVAEAAPEPNQETKDAAPDVEADTNSGIFAYFENDKDKALFVEKVAEAVAEGMTYAQIDKHLQSGLSSEIYSVAKDHPTLTKNYIRSIREKNAK